jgi:lipopolysaccharide biosynthesis glycosyltransferase
MFNFLYCFDNNYNVPAFCSILSLLENVEEKINIVIMHKSMESFKEFPKAITEHRNINKLNIHTVKTDNYKFPNIEGTHISEATYYRLLIEDYVDKELDSLIYLDCDVICIDNPLDKFKNLLIQLKNSKSTVGVLPEPGMFNYGKENYNLENTYFNAGVMVIDYRKWKEARLKEIFFEIINDYDKKLKYWDQDVLNIYFNKKYIEIPPDLNFKVDMEVAEKNGEYHNVNLLHYSGKFKPWSIKGALNYNSEYFQESYRKLFNTKYYFLFNYKKNAIKDLFRGLFNLSIMTTKYPKSFIYIALRMIIRG